MRRFLVLLVVIPILASACTPAPRSERSSGGEVREQYFQVRLPAGWALKPESDADTRVFASEAGNEQLSVSLMWAKQPLSSVEQSQTLARVVETWRASIQQASPKEMSDVQFSQRGELLAAAFHGVSTSGTSSRFSCLGLCSANVVGIFYYEALGLGQADAEARARRILDTASVAR